MKVTARIVELKQIPSEAEGLPPKYVAYVTFKGAAAGSASLNVSPDLYHRLQVVLSRGEHPELDVELLFEGR